MNTQIQDLREQLATLADDARALMAATADVAGEKAVAARQRLAAALARKQEEFGQVRDQVMAQGKALDQSVRGCPYQAIGIALGVGVLAGLFLRLLQGRDPSESEKQNEKDEKRLATCHRSVS